MPGLVHLARCSIYYRGDLPKISDPTDTCSVNNKVGSQQVVFERTPPITKYFINQTQIASSPRKNVPLSCGDGNLKWVLLMLWAGADPYSRGPDSPEQESDPAEDNNALEKAAFHGHLDIFKLKAIHLDPKRPDSWRLAEHACHAENSDVLKLLFERGFNPQDWEDKGSSLIQELFWSMSFDWEFDPTYGFKKNEKDLDTPRSRESIKMIHLLVRHGARWNPDKRDVNYARRSLLKMVPDYTVEFVWIMSKYKACAKEYIEQLLRPSPIRILVEKQQSRLNELIANLR